MRRLASLDALNKSGNYLLNRKTSENMVLRRYRRGDRLGHRSRRLHCRQLAAERMVGYRRPSLALAVEQSRSVRPHRMAHTRAHCVHRADIDHHVRWDYFRVLEGDAEVGTYRTATSQQLATTSSRKGRGISLLR